MTRATFTRHETSKYKLTQLPYGFELMRKSDARRAFFQGDDANTWHENLDAIEAVETWSPAYGSFDGAFDVLCSQYDDVLQLG